MNNCLLRCYSMQDFRISPKSLILILSKHAKYDLCIPCSPKASVNFSSEMNETDVCSLPTPHKIYNRIAFPFFSVVVKSKNSARKYCQSWCCDSVFLTRQCRLSSVNKRQLGGEAYTHKPDQLFTKDSL